MCSMWELIFNLGKRQRTKKKTSRVFETLHIFNWKICWNAFWVDFVSSNSFSSLCLFFSTAVAVAFCAFLKWSVCWILFAGLYVSLNFFLNSLRTRRKASLIGMACSFVKRSFGMVACVLMHLHNNNITDADINCLLFCATYKGSILYFFLCKHKRRVWRGG